MQHVTENSSMHSTYILDDLLDPHLRLVGAVDQGLEEVKLVGLERLENEPLQLRALHAESLVFL